MIEKLVKLIVKNSPGRMKIRAILLQCYHHAIHDRYFEAKDLLMKARISQII